MRILKLRVRKSDLCYQCRSVLEARNLNFPDHLSMEFEIRCPMCKRYRIIRRRFSSRKNRLDRRNGEKQNGKEKEEAGTAGS